jgi:16S rRNA (guanine(966)-N(2))-methyltransferase RsmD
MRITGGEFKGRRPKVSRSFKGRPTTDFGRESLFNVLRSRVDLDGLVILELFAGTGMVALEFLSRGCESVVSVEKDPGAIRGMHSIARSWELDQWQIIRGDAMGFVKKSLTQYDLIFADPPYDLAELTAIPKLVMESPLLAKDGWFILEHGERTDVSQVPGYKETRKYGHVHFSLFKK